VNIVTWNSRHYLPEALASIDAQTYRDFYLLVIDNASTDGTVEFIRAHYPNVAVLRNHQNCGFARAHNQGIAYAKAHLAAERGEPLVLVTNPDVVLEPDCLEKLVAGIDARPDAGSAGGKLLKITKGRGELDEPVKTDRLDSTGLLVRTTRQVVDRGAGEKDVGQHDRMEEVFGITGALTLFRLRALEDAAWRGEYYDEDMFAYKEDVDLAWRLRLRGWTALYVPAARAYHYRAAAGGEKARWRELAAGRRRRPSYVNRLSARNQLLLLVKNEQAANWWRHFPRICGWELAKAAYALFAQPRVCRAYFSFLRLLPRALAKRRHIMKNARVSAREIRKWFV